jgi:hypothetical protein
MSDAPYPMFRLPPMERLVSYERQEDGIILICWSPHDDCYEWQAGAEEVVVYRTNDPDLKLIGQRFADGPFSGIKLVDKDGNTYAMTGRRER